MTEIGETAGRVWRRLAHAGPAIVKDLAKEPGLDQSPVQMSIGWLAREGKVTLDKKGKGLTVALTEEELSKGMGASPTPPESTS